MNLTVGSGDVYAMMAGTHTKTYGDLLRKFVAEDKPYYNALASPIDACRVGAIIEQRYALLVPDDYFIQRKVVCSELDCFVSSLDFAKINGGNVIDFDELKSIYLTDFIEIIIPMKNSPESEYLKVIKKTFKKYYNQVQFQLLCSGLESANLVFVCVFNYNDDENYLRDIAENEICKFRINADKEVHQALIEKGRIFQEIKNTVNGHLP